MRIWFDTEFIEDGKTIELISIGAVKEDGSTFYVENKDCDHSRASDWVKENVLPHLSGGINLCPRATIATDFKIWCGESPEFWAYFAAYDWVVLCQLYGTMMDLPDGWPMFCRDVQQLKDERKITEAPAQNSTEHNALADALYTRDLHRWLLNEEHQSN